MEKSTHTKTPPDESDHACIIRRKKAQGNKSMEMDIKGFGPLFSAQQYELLFSFHIEKLETRSGSLLNRAESTVRQLKIDIFGD